MDREDKQELQHVPLAVAVAVVLYKVTGKQVNGVRSPETVRVFNEVAHAMAHVVPIYTTHSNGLPKELAQAEVRQGRFDHGAILFRAVDGAEYDDLTVQRRDITSAINTLKSANIRFG